MKLPLSLLFSIFSLSLIYAKMPSKLEVSNIRAVTIEEGKIIIIGDTTLRSRVVTTNENKDSDYLISGKPSTSYTAKGYDVKIVVTPYELHFNGVMPIEDKDKWDKVEQNFKKIWRDNLDLVKIIKENQVASIIMQGADVRLDNGKLVYISGNGVIQAKSTSKK